MILSVWNKLRERMCANYNEKKLAALLAQMPSILKEYYKKSYTHVKNREKAVMIDKTSTIHKNPIVQDYLKKLLRYPPHCSDNPEETIISYIKNHYSQYKDVHIISCISKYSDNDYLLGHLYSVWNYFNVLEKDRNQK